MLFTFEDKSSAYIIYATGGVSIVHISLSLMNSFSKTEAAILPIQAMLPEGFPFFSDLCHYS